MWRFSTIKLLLNPWIKVGLLVSPVISKQGVNSNLLHFTRKLSGWVGPVQQVIFK